MSVRNGLQRRNGERFRVTAVFERWGTKRGWRGATKTTLLLRDVRDAKTGELLTDHLWFTSGVTWDDLCLEPGHRVAFDARVSWYEKGYQGRRAERLGEWRSAIDYRLERPTKAEVIGDKLGDWDPAGSQCREIAS